MRTRSEQTSSAFIRKTPNYPLFPALFHLPRGERRLLIRNAASSTIALAGEGVGVGGHMPTSPSESPHDLTLGGQLSHRTRRLLSALLRRMLTNWSERRPVPASCPTAEGGHANRRPRPALCASPAHGRQPRKRRSGPHAAVRSGAGRPLFPPSFLLAPSLLQQSQPPRTPHHRVLWLQGPFRGHRPCTPTSRHTCLESSREAGRGPHDPGSRALPGPSAPYTWFSIFRPVPTPTREWELLRPGTLCEASLPLPDEHNARPRGAA